MVHVSCPTISKNIAKNAPMLQDWFYVTFSSEAFNVDHHCFQKCLFIDFLHKKDKLEDKKALFIVLIWNRQH